MKEEIREEEEIEEMGKIMGRKVVKKRLIGEGYKGVKKKKVIKRKMFEKKEW